MAGMRVRQTVTGSADGKNTLSEQVFYPHCFYYPVDRIPLRGQCRGGEAEKVAYEMLHLGGGEFYAAFYGSGTGHDSRHASAHLKRRHRFLSVCG